MDEYKKQLYDIAYSEDTYNKITIIGNKYNLTIDQVGELSAEIRDVITNITSTSKFTENVKERLEINSLQANQIADDVNKQIFINIRDSLRKIQEGTDSATTTPPPQQQRPTTPPQPIPTTQYNTSNLSRESLMDQLEHPPVGTPPTVSFVDHLLVNPKDPMPPILQPKTPQPQTPPPQKLEPKQQENITRRSVDPYREQI